MCLTIYYVGQNVNGKVSMDLSTSNVVFVVVFILVTPTKLRLWHQEHFKMKQKQVPLNSLV